MESAVAVQVKGRAWGRYCATKVSIWRTRSVTWRNDPRRVARGATDVHGPSSSPFLPIDMKISPVAEYIKLFTGLYTSRLLKNSAGQVPVHDPSPHPSPTGRGSKGEGAQRAPACSAGRDQSFFSAACW